MTNNCASMVGQNKSETVCPGKSGNGWFRTSGWTGNSTRNIFTNGWSRRVDRGFASLRNSPTSVGIAPRLGAGGQVNL